MTMAAGPRNRARLSAIDFAAALSCHRSGTPPGKSGAADRENAMARVRTVDVSRVIDERGISRFNIGLLIFAFFIVLIDGYDIAAIGFAAPALARAWNITDQSTLGPVLGASLIGMLVGAPVLGLIGDRFGRRRAIISSCLIFGVFTWAAVLSTAPSQLAWLRFFAGIGIGGFMPNIVALTAEFAPRRYRATMVVLMFTGVGFGGGLPGLVAATLVPSYGWQILFTIGGTVPLLVAAVCWIGLPESVKYLTLVPERRADLVRLLKRVRPDLSFGDDVQFALADEKQYPGLSPRKLFGDGLGLITPLLWLLFVLNLMGYFFLLSWTPFLLASANLPMSKAAIAQTFFQLGGTAGGIALCRPMDNRGLWPVAILFVLAVPAVALIGYVGTISETLLMTVEFFAGFCVLGLQLGLNATAAAIYPTSFRSNGIGWALGVGRVGAIVGPILGGYLIAMHLPVQRLFVFASIPFAVGAVACIVLAQLYVTRFHGAGLGQRDQLDDAIKSG
jgi:AAHS family 4-hydroxybenzoate transporter-like MFS transporter